MLYPDVSNNQWAGSPQAAINFVAGLKAQGFGAVVHKVSEGSYYMDPFWPAVQRTAAANGLLALGYHYVTEDDPAAQAAMFTGNNGGANVMLDFELNSGDLSNFWNVVNGFNNAGVNVALAYIPRWYLSEVGGDLSVLAPNGIGLVSSAYPDGLGFASDVYAAAGGDAGEGWVPYFGGTPIVWQFTDSASVGGIVVDCNAFKGTVKALELVFGEAA